MVAGIDEAGRGPLAGPVVAGAAALRDHKSRERDFRFLRNNANDSKKLSPEKREQIYQEIIACQNIVWGAGRVDQKMIDKINILEASKLAMTKAMANLMRKLGKGAPPRTICLIDGNFAIDVSCAQKSIVAGDAKVFSIALASIIAKVTRDRIMRKMDKIYPAYGFCRHKGYPTKEHLAALAKHGLTPIHRRTFSPCAAIARNA